MENALGNGVHVILMTTIEHEKYPVKGGYWDYVRATCFVQGTVIEKNPGGSGSKLTELRHFSPNGGMLTAVVNTVSLKMGQGLYDKYSKAVGDRTN